MNVVRHIHTARSCQLLMQGMALRLAGSIAALLVAASTVSGLLVGVPAAEAAACPDVEILFARGTFEAPGVGVTGQSFVDALTARLAGESVEVYPVNYPASLDFAAAADGVIDAANKIRDTAANCPKTKMVLGGYSQGAAVIGYITEDQIPDGYTPPAGISGPLPAQVADHIAAVVLFGKPSTAFLNAIVRDAPPITVGHRYVPKTTDMCITEDPICSPDGGNRNAHSQYAANGMTATAAEFASHRLTPM